MRAVVADDDRGTATIVASALTRAGVQVDIAHDGATAWQLLTSEPAPAIAVLDWMMPAVDGLELCRRVRQNPACARAYVIVLTGRSAPEDLVTGLDSGADEYLLKPFNLAELGARIRAGIRIAELQQRLADQVDELQAALASVKQLSGLLPICSYCKRIRTDENYWEQVESYITHHSDAVFSHGICPVCYDEVKKQFQT
jgi:DNA-binding response OmpR family regulator